MKKIYLCLFICTAIFNPIDSFTQQCFNSGTGTDGTFQATTSMTLAGGTYNYSSFIIDSGVTVTVTGGQPLIVRCTGNIDINGVLTAAGGNGTDGVTSSTFGTGGIGVAGGANGGDGSYSSSTGPLNGVSGSGTGGGGYGAGWSGGGGGGYSTTGSSSGGVGGTGGAAYDDIYLSLLSAGSGGGGGSGGFSCGSGGGGAGGGMIVLHAAGMLTISATGVVNCNGGNGGSDGTGNCGGGGGGSGGTIWLASPSISNDGMITATGGSGGASTVPGNPYYGGGANGADGRIRIDHGDFTNTGTITPPAGSTFQIFGSASDTICQGDTIVISGNTYTTAGTFTDTSANLIGCDSIFSVTITVVPVPNVSAGADQGICDGDSVTLSGTGAMIYSWNNGVSDGIPFLPSGTNNYIVSGTDTTSGCSNTDTITVTVNPLPTVNLGSDIVQPSPPAILDAGSGFSTYLWSTTAATQTISVSSNGTYSVLVTDTNGCQDSDTIMVTFTAGIEGSETPINLKVYPNPSNGIFFVSSDHLTGDLVMEIMDMNGRILYSQLFASVSGTFSQQIIIEDLNVGTYLLRITSGKNSKSLPIIIAE